MHRDLTTGRFPMGGEFDVSKGQIPTNPLGKERQGTIVIYIMHLSSVGPIISPWAVGGDRTSGIQICSGARPHDPSLQLGHGVGCCKTIKSAPISSIWEAIR